MHRNEGGRCRLGIFLATFAALALWAAPLSRAVAGPPFLTDDPAPVDYQHYEGYVFTTTDTNDGGNVTNGPAIEFNYGVVPNVQLHLVVPNTFSDPVGGPHTSGLGDTEFGIKFRFIQETSGRPQIGVFPMAEIATGNAGLGLGNGRTWFRLPIWIQKSWGPWTTYGGGGYAIDTAAGMRNYDFGGWLVQRDFGEHWTLGGEVFSQGATTTDGQFTTLYNVGGYYKPNDTVNILFSLGHSIAGERHAIGYFGLYFTWGPKNTEPEH